MNANGNSANWRLMFSNAERHLASVKAQVDEFLGAQPFEVHAAMVPATTSQAFRPVRPEDVSVLIASATVHQDPPQDLAPVIGDVVSNVRAALDQLATHLAELNAGKEIRGTEFPIFVDKSEFDRTDARGDPARGSGRYKIRGFSQDGQNAIDVLQPFNSASPTSHPLWLLHELRNINQHRRPLLTGTVLTSSAFGINELDGYDIIASPSSATTLKTGPFGDGSIIGRLELRATKTRPVINVVAHAFFSLAFDLPDPLYGRELESTLDEITTFVRDKVFVELERFA